MQKIINRLKKIIFNLVTSGLICCTTVSGHSMMPTVHDGDRLLYNPFFKNVERGDVVVISHGGDMLIKRVIAIGGGDISSSNNINLNWRMAERNIHKSAGTIRRKH